MSIDAAATQRSYDLHGIGLTVSTESPHALQAIDHRLRRFVSDDREHAGPELRIEFLIRRPGEASRLTPGAAGRAVFETPAGAMTYDDASDTLLADVAGVGVWCRAANAIARIECADFRGRPLYIATHTLATVCLIELLKRRGLFNMHAACLSHGAAGILLAGPSGAGKSTLAIALVRAGLGFLSDDMTYLRRTDAGVRALAFPDAVGITDRTLHRFAELREHATGPPPDGFPKHLVRMEAAFAVAHEPHCEPRVLIFPQVATNSPSRLIACDPREAMRRLVPDVILTRAQDAQAHLATLAALLEQVECYHLRSGPDLDASVDLLIGALA